MLYRENVPLAVMSAISLAVLFLFGISEMEMRASQRQHNSCSGSQEIAIAPASLLPSRGPRDLSPPASGPLSTSRLPARIGCTISSTTAIG